MSYEYSVKSVNVHGLYSGVGVTEREHASKSINMQTYISVSYTHLTLPTKRIV